MAEPAAGIQSDLVDLTGVTLDDLGSFDDGTLASALRPLLAQIDTPGSSIGGHDS